MNLLKTTPIAALLVVAANFALADYATLQKEGVALLGEKKPAEAAEKMIAAVESIDKGPRKFNNDFRKALEALLNAKKDAEVQALAERALAIDGLAESSRPMIQLCRIKSLIAQKKKDEAKALANDMAETGLNTADFYLLACQAENIGEKGKYAWLKKCESYLDAPHRYGFRPDSPIFRSLVGNYTDRCRMDIKRLEKVKKYYAQMGQPDKRVPFLEELYELQKFPLSEEELNIPDDLNDFGFDPKRKVVHAKDFGWNPTNATECLQKAIDSDASTVIVDDMGSPWYILSVDLTPEKGSNKQIVFKKGVKILSVPLHTRKGEPGYYRGPSLFNLTGAPGSIPTTNVVFIGEGTADDVYIGMYPDRDARYKSGYSYGGNGFGGLGKYVLVKNLTSANNLSDGFCMGGSYHYIVNCKMNDNYRQGLSICSSHHCVYKNTVFARNVGGEPHNGVDFEPCYALWYTPSHYFFDCKFYDNAAGNVVFSTGTYVPVTALFKRCEFEAGRYANITFVPHIGHYLDDFIEAPSKIVFDECRIDSYSDATAVRWNALFLNTEFKNCVFNDKGQLDPTRAPNRSPFFFGLDRDYYKGFYPHAGKVVFENVTVNGFADKPLFQVADYTGAVGINTLRGMIDHNGKKVDASKFSFLPPDLAFGESADPDLAKLDTAAKADATAKFTPAFALDFDHAWYQPAMRYCFFAKGEKGAKASITLENRDKKCQGKNIVLTAPSGAESIIAEMVPGTRTFAFTFPETGVHMIFPDTRTDEDTGRYVLLGTEGFIPAICAYNNGSMGRTAKINCSANEGPRTVGYFEVAGGKELNVKLLRGGIEILNENGEVVASKTPSDYIGTVCLSAKPRADAIWSFRLLTDVAHIKFFAPASSIWATSPEALPTCGRNLKYTVVEGTRRAAFVEKEMPPIPEKYAEEVAALAAKRLADAKESKAVSVYEEAAASLEKMKANAKDEDAHHQVDDLTRRLKRLKHLAKATEQALAETEEQRQWAVFCEKFAIDYAPEYINSESSSLDEGVLSYPGIGALKELYSVIVTRMAK